ncbi:Oidioi.mRNA.OKI2018_I69.chr1.g3659.t1.cds [Oikopleura dioica]|uniref:Oidioi.mRNA.OKI2018_I69.chr1.g3659.t1.cds n=1 Tax=Oikopleura dioica TaxID=34765 RepID=A0ABN7T1P5_OIKDI|nr:Oidioi.mRNA.OKI2018_I69.chr1.g3659.t1.cds [Oikopleura dioica]
MVALKLSFLNLVFGDLLCTENCKTDLGNCYSACEADQYCKYLCTADFNRCEEECPERSCADYCCEHLGSGVPGCSYMVKYYDAKLCSASCSDECYLCYDTVVNDYECYTSALNDVTCDCDRTLCN